MKRSLDRPVTTPTDGILQTHANRLAMRDALEFVDSDQELGGLEIFTPPAITPETQQQLVNSWSVLSNNKVQFYRALFFSTLSWGLVFIHGIKPFKHYPNLEGAFIVINMTLLPLLAVGLAKVVVDVRKNSGVMEQKTLQDLKQTTI